MDALGLKTWWLWQPVLYPGMPYPRHTYIRIKCDSNCDSAFPTDFKLPLDQRLELTGPLINGRAHGSSKPFAHEEHSLDNIEQRPWVANAWGRAINYESYGKCALESCIAKAYLENAANVPIYNSRGPNSNTFANRILTACGVFVFYLQSEYGWDYGKE